MTYKLLSVAAMALTVGTAGVFAQTTTQPGVQPGMQEPGGTPAAMHDRMPAEWEGPIGEAFFADTDSGELLDEDQRLSNWENLGDEEQAQVREFCENQQQAALGTQPGQAGDTTGQGASAGGLAGTTAQVPVTTGEAGATGSTVGQTPGQTAAVPGQAGDTTGQGGSAMSAAGGETTTMEPTRGAAFQQASLEQICEMVEGDA